jgi:hypothetical protein
MDKLNTNQMIVWGLTVFMAFAIGTYWGGIVAA